MGTGLVLGLLVIMCGGIAYTGDLLGRRMGKKRLTLFGLRPRHTAVVFTIATGMVIAAITLTVLFFAAAGVRFALTNGERLLHENHILKRERLDLDKLRHKLITNNDILLKKNDVLLSTTSELGQRNNTLRAETGRLQSINGDLRQKNTRLSERNLRLERRNAALQSGNDRLAAENQLLDNANHRFARTNKQLLGSNGDLKGRNQGLQTRLTGLIQAGKRAQQRLTRTQGELVLTQNYLGRVRGELERTAEVVKKESHRRAEAERVAERATELEVGQVVVHAREELARGVIPPGGSADAVRGVIEKLLDDASAEVARRENPASVNGAHPRRVRLALPGGPYDQWMDAMVERLKTESHPLNGQLPTSPIPEIHPLVVRALAHANTAAGTSDPVEVDVVGKVNLLAFRRGQEVASMEVATANTTGQLLKSLFTFLRRDVRETAMRRSVLPDAAGQVGEIDPEALLDVVAKVKRLSGRAHIGAIAAQETWTSGPLQLDFYVVPAETRVATDKSEKEE